MYIIGEVNKQGYFGYKPNMTLGRLFSHAEGIKNSASKQALVIRGNLQHPRVYSFLHQDILKGRSQDFKLEPNDIVYIPKGVLGTWNAILAEISPSLDVILKSFKIDNEFYERGWGGYE